MTAREDYRNRENREAAWRLANELTADIMKARDRESHIRATARATAAVELANNLSEELPAPAAG